MKLGPLSISLAVTVVAVSTTACSKKDGGGETATLPADAKTVEAYKGEAGFNGGQLKGKRVKVHGYAQSLSSNNVPVSAAADKTVPFVFCATTKAPVGVKDKGHVLAEGNVDEMGNLKECTLSAL